MTKINFFDAAYVKEAAKNDKEFGIYDPGNSQPALTTKDLKLYQATVLNPQGHSLQFVPVDHNMDIRRANGEQESTCDGMMYDNKEYLSFIELKDKDQGWASEAVDQLRNTISLFGLNHNIFDFKRRRAYAVNVQHPVFHRSFKQVMQQFKAETKFVLRYETRIEVNYP